MIQGRHLLSDTISRERKWEVQICPANQPFRSDCLKSRSSGRELFEAARVQRSAKSYAGVANVMSNLGVTGGMPRPYNHSFQSMLSSFFSISLPCLSVNQVYRKDLKSALVKDLNRK